MSCTSLHNNVRNVVLVVIKQTNKARGTVGCINRNIINETPDNMLPLFKAMIKPIVENGNSVWVPYFKKDYNINKLIAIIPIDANTNLKSIRPLLKKNRPEVKIHAFVFIRTIL